MFVSKLSGKKVALSLISKENLRQLGKSHCLCERDIRSLSGKEA